MEVFAAPAPQALKDQAVVIRMVGWLAQVPPHLTAKAIKSPDGSEITLSNMRGACPPPARCERRVQARSSATAPANGRRDDHRDEVAALAQARRGAFCEGAPTLTPSFGAIEAAASTKVADVSATAAVEAAAGALSRAFMSAEVDGPSWVAGSNLARHGWHRWAAP